jgi:hypothetical protein
LVEDMISVLLGFRSGYCQIFWYWAL